jgi:hypothetical protein
MAIWYILWPFVVIWYMYFVANWSIFSGLGKFYLENLTLTRND